MTDAVILLLIVTVVWLVIVGLVIKNRLLVQLQREKRRVRLLHLWARERRADLARLVSLFIQTWDDETITKSSAFERLDDFETELRKQTSYVGIAWAENPTPAEGFTQPEKLTSAELLELLDLSRELGDVS